MSNFITRFELGPYVGQAVKTDPAQAETGYINGLINMVIDNAAIEFDNDALDRAIPGILKELRETLEANQKPLRIYCYLNGITEEELPAFVRANVMRTAAENRVIAEIAQAERIEVTEKDLYEYKALYREQYARTLLNDPVVTDDNLKAAIQTKKVLAFLMNNNTRVDEV